jgi:hypothetical protein
MADASTSLSVWVREDTAVFVSSAPLGIFFGAEADAYSCTMDFAIHDTRHAIPGLSESAVVLASGVDSWRFVSLSQPVTKW